MNESQRNQQDHDNITTILATVVKIEKHLETLNGRVGRAEEKNIEQGERIVGLDKDIEVLRGKTAFWGKVVSFILSVIALIQVWAKFAN